MGGNKCGPAQQGLVHTFDDDAAAGMHAVAPQSVMKGRAPHGHSSSVHSTPGDQWWDAQEGGLGWLLIVNGGVSKIDTCMHTEFNVSGV